MARMRIIALALLVAGCNQTNDQAQLDRIEASLNRIEAHHRQLPAPMSKVEYDQLPAGTTFLAPDGTVRKKPDAKR